MFSVYALNATEVQVCLFDRDAQGRESERRVPLRHRAHGSWFGTVPGVRAGQRYGFRADGPWEPGRAQRYNPSKLVLDPYARALEGDVTLDPALFAHHVGPDLTGDLDRARPTRLSGIPPALRHRRRHVRLGGR